MQKLSIILLGSLLVISGCSAKENMQTNNAKSEKVSGLVAKTDENTERNEAKAPDFKLATISGEEFSLSDYKGKVVMLNFWGTWCPPCRKEIPDLVNLQEKYNKDGLEIVGITLNSGSAAEIQKFADNRDMNYTLLTDINNNETSYVTNLYGKVLGQPISAVPTTLIIDRDGYIVKGYIGPRTEEIFYNDLKEYL